MAFRKRRRVFQSGERFAECRKQLGGQVGQLFPGNPRLQYLSGEYWESSRHRADRAGTVDRGSEIPQSLLSFYAYQDVRAHSAAEAERTNRRERRGGAG